MSLKKLLSIFFRKKHVFQLFWKEICFHFLIIFQSISEKMLLFF